VRNVFPLLPTADAEDIPAWSDWMILQIIRREAEALVQQRGGSP
jgi:hypothetical protein